MSRKLLCFDCQLLVNSYWYKDMRNHLLPCPVNCRSRRIIHFLFVFCTSKLNSIVFSGPDCLTLASCLPQRRSLSMRNSGLLHIFYSRTCLDEKGLQRQIGVGYIGQQPGTKSASRRSDKLRINRLSTAGQERVLFLQRFT